jgi:hypothetical protein
LAETDARLDLMATDDIPGFSWTAMAPAEWLRTWQAMWRMPPDHFVQPILPGWTFNINSGNSTAPQTEAEVVARHSYGRQIGRMSDALALLIAQSHGNTPEDKPFADFLKMKREIDKVKQDAAAARVERIVKDLALLEAQDHDQYARLRNALREALK